MVDEGAASQTADDTKYIMNAPWRPFHSCDAVHRKNEWRIALDVRYLNYILEIAHQRSITKAASVLYVSQSSLSQYLSKLEQELGTPLFVRKKHDLELTPAGHLYVEAAKSVIHIQRQLYRSIASLSQTGTIRIGVSTQWGFYLITDLILPMKQKYPGLTVQILEGTFIQMKKQLADGQLDMALLAIASEEDLPERLEIVAREEILLAVPENHHYCLSHPDATTLDARELEEVFGQESFIMSATGSTLRRLTDQYFIEQLFDPRVLCEMNRNNATQVMVSRGLGVAMMPACYQKDVVGIRYFTLDPGLYRYNVLALRRNYELHEADYYLIDAMKKSPMLQNP
jgi:DNA-binding transcriptional LysR family regulator